MVNLSEDHHIEPIAVDSPDNPYEHKVCGVTLFAAIAFMAAGIYFLLAPGRDQFALTIVMVAGGAFVLTLLNFFVAAFRGKLCGCDKK